MQRKIVACVALLVFLAVFLAVAGNLSSTWADDRAQATAEGSLVGKQVEVYFEREFPEPGFECVAEVDGSVVAISNVGVQVRVSKVWKYRKNEGGNTTMPSEETNEDRFVPWSAIKSIKVMK